MPVITSAIGPVICPRPYATVKVAAASNDPAQRVRMLPKSNVFSITGTTSNSGIARSSLTLTLDGRRISVPLGGGLSPKGTFEAIRAALPPGYEAQQVGAKKPSKSGAIAVRISKSLAPPTPALELVVANDRSQRVSLAAGNKIQIEGIATNEGLVPSFVNLSVDGHRVLVRIDSGATARRTAEQLSASLPKGYKAKIELSDAQVTVSIVRG